MSSLCSRARGGNFSATVVSVARTPCISIGKSRLDDPSPLNLSFERFLIFYGLQEQSLTSGMAQIHRQCVGLTCCPGGNLVSIK